MTNINQQEKLVLFKEKMQEDKTPLQANEEIKRDVEFVKNTSLLNSEVRKLKKENAFLLASLRKLNFQLQEEHKKRMVEVLHIREKKVKLTDASLNHCNRVISYLSEFGLASKDKITKGCGIDCNKTKVILNFLMKHDVIEQVKGYIPIYQLKEKEIQNV